MDFYMGRYEDMWRYEGGYIIKMVGYQIHRKSVVSFFAFIFIDCSFSLILAMEWFLMVRSK